MEPHPIPPPTLSGHARLAGVCGWPVAHSLSPRVHGWWLHHYGIDGAYVPLAIRPQDFQHALRALPRMGFRGVNVTIPHKEAALHLADRADDNARRIGAANTLFFDENGSIEARNTDGVGFLANILAHTAAREVSFAPQTALILGAGGAARAVLVALMDAGTTHILLCNRTRQRAQELRTHMITHTQDQPGTRCTISVLAWEERHEALAKADIVVNTTSLGMEGQQPLVLHWDHLRPATIVNDIVYTPLETPLLRAAREHGAFAVDGLGMLLHQAIPGFKTWFGTCPDVSDSLRNFVLDAIGSPSPADQ